MKPAGENPSSPATTDELVSRKRRSASTSPARRLALLVVVSFAWLCSACGASTQDGGAGSETNWLSRCGEDSDCDEGSCLCGVCTVVCESDSDCSAISEQADCTPASQLQCPDVPTKGLCGENDTPFESETDAPDGGPAAETDEGDGTDGGSSDVDEATDESPAPGEAGGGGSQTGAPPTKVDLLFVVDNSMSMADKQEALALTLPDLVSRLVSPRCIDSDGNDTGTTPQLGEQECPEGSREFTPMNDIHVAVITSSLGGFGAFGTCVESGAEASEQSVDMAHLLGSLARGGEAAPSAASSGFLSWTAETKRDAFVPEFTNLVRNAGEFGCGWESTLEAWNRFLVDPYPYTSIERQPCNSSDSNNLCAGPATDGSGNQLVDLTLLNQRADFLRPDSLLAIVMLSDENDCSFQASGQMWRLAQTVNEDGGFNPAFKGAAACSDPALGPNHECCQSCGSASIAAGCPTATIEDGTVVAAGCEDSRRYGADGLQDHPNLRCFQQKARFGVDYLFPVERYSNALKLQKICPFADDLAPDPADPSICRDGTAPVVNPLFRDLPFERQLAEDPSFEGTPAPVRPKEHIILAGIIGVPWQDLAVSANPKDELVYRVNDADAPSAQRINWSWLIGERDVDATGGLPRPQDPLMLESIEPRNGTNPATGEALAPPDSGSLANAINGHEWSITDNSDLQYACIYPLAQEKECLSAEEQRNLLDSGAAVPACDCTDFGGDEYQNPLCQASGGEFDQTQRYAKAYPGLRQLQVLYDFGDNSIVASICPKESLDPDARDFGYRPFVSALMGRIRPILEP